MRIKVQSVRTYGSKIVLREKLIAMNAYIKNTEQSQINN
jgi:hypothetical protein